MALWCLAATAQAQWQDVVPASAKPSMLYMQVGDGEDTAAYGVGATWDMSGSRDTRWGRLDGYWDAAVGHWKIDPDKDGISSRHATHLGITPVLRLYPSTTAPEWFVEAGIGVNVLFPIYRRSGKSFSTVFNFGDHLGVGRRFGETGRHEVSLRLQHFSNAGIRHPNPGANITQLRYAYRY